MRHSNPAELLILEVKMGLKLPFTLGFKNSQLDRWSNEQIQMFPIFNEDLWVNIYKVLLESQKNLVGYVNIGMQIHVCTQRRSSLKNYTTPKLSPAAIWNFHYLKKTFHSKENSIIQLESHEN